MTDTQPFTIQESDSQVLQWYKRLFNQTAVLDESLDAGSEAATKTKFRNEVVEKNKPFWENGVSQLSAQLTPLATEGDEKFDMEKFVGTYLGIVRGLTSAFKTKTDEWIDAQVASLPKPDESEKLSDEERTKVSKERSELVKQIKTIIEMAKNFGEEGAENWALPSRRGAAGPRGKRILYTYDWSIDGQELEGDDNDPKGVAEKLGFAKVGDFTDWMRTQTVGGKKFNTTKPPASFTMEYNGHQIVGEAPSDEEEEGDEEVTNGEVTE